MAIHSSITALGYNAVRMCRKVLMNDEFFW
jgi:hypothetical protein